MCGFAGIVSWDGRYRIERPVLEKMSARIAHRGPDGEGIWLNHEGEISPERPQVGLVHRRLAIIDLDPRANQPFTDGQGRWLVFNGEIYNYRELRKELEGLLPDYAWRTSSDTEVLLASYAAWGEKCVEKLNGMFAFAIWDEGKGELFLARDRMGQKPLYVATLPNRYGELRADEAQRVPTHAIVFSSELNALLQLNWFDRSIGLEELTNYLKNGYVFGCFPADNTIYRGATQLRQSMWKRVSAGVTHQHRYFWQSRDEDGLAPGSNDICYSDSESAILTRKLVAQSVNRQLVADVPVGCFLSGGIDSSIIAACMKESASSQQKIMTFSIGFDDARYDESQYAQRVAGHLGTTHHRFQVCPDAIHDLPKLAASFGEPFADSSALPTQYLSRETRAYVKVALSGDGGDELFGGYDRYRAMALAKSLRTCFTPIPWFLLSRCFKNSIGDHPKSRWTRIKRFAASIGTSTEYRYAGYMRLFPRDILHDLISYEPPQNLNFDLILSEFMSWNPDSVRQALYVDRETYLPMDLLTKADRCSMLYALELRAPFLDHELIQFASRLRWPQLLKGGPKRMLREAFADMLPAWVFKRKKMGFAVPIGEWFRGPLRAMLRDSLFAANSFASSHFKMPVVQRLIEEHETEKIDHSQRLYALLMLELWWQQQ